MSNEIGLSRRQRVYVAIETVKGTLVWPNITDDYIRPAGNATLNQNPTFSDSEELADTLDLLDQFANATPAGVWEVPMYIRPSGTIGTKPQGSDLLESFQGLCKQAVAATLDQAITIGAVIMHVDGLSATDYIPSVGVVKIENEKILYTGKSAVGASAATLSGCTRGYGSTTATNHANDVAVEFTSIFYKQAQTHPSLSVWVQTDHFVQALSGATVSKGTLGITNEGAVKITAGGNGMRMYWAGTSHASDQGTALATVISVDDGTLFTAGMRVYNRTQNLTNSNKGWLINSVTGNVLHLAEALGVIWATDDEVSGFLPAGTAIGDPIEARDSAVALNGVAARIRTMDLNLDYAIKYIEDEIGSTYPEDYIEDLRNISSTLSLYFKKADAKYFSDGYNADEVPVKLTFGDTPGSMMVVYLPRTILQVPTINFAPPAIELSIPMRALGTVGEDSLEIIFY